MSKVCWWCQANFGDSSGAKEAFELKLGELGDLSFRIYKLDELGEVSFEIYKLVELGEVSFGMLNLGELSGSWKSPIFVPLKLQEIET